MIRGGFFLLLLSCLLLRFSCYIDIPLAISRTNNKTGEISYNFNIDVSGYSENISLSLNNKQADSITSVSDMKKVYKNKKLKRGKYNTEKNHNSVFGEIEATSLEGYSFEGWKRYFMEAFLYIESRYYHSIEIDLNSIETAGDQDSTSTDSRQQLTNGVMTLGPKLKDNQLYQQIKKNTDFIEFDIVAFYSGVGERNNRIQLGGYEESYAKGDIKTGALLYEFPLKANGDFWEVAVQKVYFTRSKHRKTDEFLLKSSLSMYKLSLESEYIIFPASMRQSIENFVESENNECSLKVDGFLECKNMSTIDISLSEFAFELTPNYFINISLYDLRKDYDPESKKISFFIKLDPDESESSIQIGSNILKEYYIAIDMNQQTLLYSPINRFKSDFSSVYALRFFVYFIIFTLVAAVFVGVWANMTDPNRRKKMQYGKDGIQLITYQRPGAYGTIQSQHNEFDD